MNTYKTLFRVHALERMFERRISATWVSKVLQSGETIEDYSADMPEPGRLVLGFQAKRPLHVVVSENSDCSEVTVITAYIPRRDKWEHEFKRRRS